MRARGRGQDVAWVERAWAGRSPLRRYAVVSAVFLLLFSVVDITTYRFFVTEPEASVWFPATALDVVLLLVFGLRYVPVMLLTAPVHYALASPSELSLVQTFGLDVANTLVEAAGAAFLLHVIRIDPRLLRKRDVLWFLGTGAFAAPLLSAIAVTGLTVASGNLAPDRYASAALHDWAGRATGIGMLASALLVGLRRYPPLWHRPPQQAADALQAHRRVPWWESALQAASLALVVVAAYGTREGQTLDYTYLVFVPLIWVAVRHGFARTTVAVLAVNVTAVVVVKATRGDVGSFALQFGLMSLTLTALVLAALVSEERNVLERLRHDALHDRLTGLPNRALLADRMDQLLRRAGRSPSSSFAVLILDLDRFKGVNDGLGHLAGDQVLTTVAGRLTATLRPGDTVARFGGDEFVILLEDVNDDAVQPTTARLLAAVSDPLRVGGHELRLSASVGLVLGRGGEADPDDLLRKADRALSVAKREGRARHVVFDSDASRDSEDILRMENELRGALARQELELHYQPIVDLDDGRVVAAEALLRWRHPGLGDVPPETFVPLAEDLGLINALGDWVLHEACHQLSAWRAAGVVLPTLSINVSARQLNRPSFVEGVGRSLAESGLDPASLQLELTESALLQPLELVRKNLSEMSRLGVGVVIDDFGTGYASLSNLMHIPVTALKIDREFVARCPDQPGAVAVVRAVLGIARAASLQVVAEGVERVDQRDFLRAEHCDRAQGFLFRHPMTGTELQTYLAGVATG